MNVPSLIVQILFLLVFLGAVREFARRRDPVSRDVALVFSPFVMLFASSLWRGLIGPPPTLLTMVSAVLLLAQPVMVLHLVSLVRFVPRPVLGGSAVLLAVTTLPIVALAPLGITGVPAQVAVLPLGSFVAVELLAAAYLLLEARRRSGPGAIRLGIAALSTAAFGAALLVVSAGVLGPDVQTVAGNVAIVLALAAAVGYLVAFLPPRRIQEIWQATTTVAYGRSLLARSSDSTEAIWNGFAELAASVSGGTCLVVVPSGENDVRTVARAGSSADQLPEAVGRGELKDLLAVAASGVERAVGTGGSLADQLAGLTGSRFISAVALPSADPQAAPVLIVLTHHRSLFHASDLDLLAALGGQTAVMAERRAVLAQQEALAERLASTVEALRSASQAKSDFLASMSHELRTPLSAILGFSDLMRAEEQQGDSVLVPLEWVEHIHTGGQHLLALINDVLDLAKVEAGRLELQMEPVDVDAAVAEVVNGVRPLADRKHLELVAEPGSVEVTADRGRFRQILYNLLSNAIKYTPDGGAVRVETGTDGTEIWVAVTDTGVGIAPADQGTVFDEFRQVGDEKDRVSGTGLGLALTRRLVEAHGGRVELASTLGEGSRFTVHLPIAQATPAVSAGNGSRPVPAVTPAAARKSESPAPARRDGVEVLVIEDDPSALRLLREYLEPAGYLVRSAPDGEAGLAMARERLPSAVLLDVLLPRVDGWEVLRQLKDDPALRDIPVVIVTVVDEREVGLALGAVDYLVKPIKREALLASLARLTPMPRSRDAAVRILAVDDEPAALALIRAALEPEGYEVLDANGGREALDLAHTQPIDLVVCDLVMPDVDGFEVITRLKGDRRTADIPIIVCTAHELTAEERDRLNGKIMGIVTKGADARDGLRQWLLRVAPIEPANGRDEVVDGAA